MCVAGNAYTDRDVWQRFLKMYYRKMVRQERERDGERGIEMERERERQRQRQTDRQTDKILCYYF